MIFPPLPWAIKCFAAAWDIKNTLLMLRFITSSQSFSLNASASSRRIRPALLTRISIWPNSATARSRS